MYVSDVFSHKTDTTALIVVLIISEDKYNYELIEILTEINERQSYTSRVTI